jgi:catechol 2,3-dioxygenase-like lactoylglutathione lyase family enzyme
LQEGITMKFYTGIITSKLQETREFYINHFNFEIKFENEWFVLLQAGGHEIGFMLPDHPTQSPRFQHAYGGQGFWITIEVEDVDAEYQRIRGLGLPIEVKIRNEPYGDRHFVVVDPNGIGVDIVTYVGITV